MHYVRSKASCGFFDRLGLCTSFQVGILLVQTLWTRLLPTTTYVRRMPAEGLRVSFQVGMLPVQTVWTRLLRTSTTYVCTSYARGAG